MKVLWYCNVILPKVAEAANLSKKAHSAGWIEGFLQEIANFKDVDLGIICPNGSYLRGRNENFRFWLVDGSSRYHEILNDFSPDILHVFGTETIASNNLIKAFDKKDKTIVNIQGMARLCGNVYLNGLPSTYPNGKIFKARLFEKYIKKSLWDQKNSLLDRGIKEYDTINSVGHVIGRTDIDRMFALTTNPNIQYHFCNEILRNDFYTDEKWSIDKKKNYTILFRNTSNPIKGLYGMLQAMMHILRIFPETHLNVIGNDLFYPSKLHQKFAESAYNKLLREFIQKNNLKNNISFLGTLNSKQMKEAYLSSHCFVSASIIENESNVVSEAKILGVPVVSSFVGGLPNRISHGYDGFLYPFEMPEMLAYYVGEIFSDDALAMRLSQNAIQSQTLINDPKTNIEQLVSIYKIIYQKQN